MQPALSRLRWSVLKAKLYIFPTALLSLPRPARRERLAVSHSELCAGLAVPYWWLVLLAVDHCDASDALVRVYNYIYFICSINSSLLHF